MLFNINPDIIKKVPERPYVLTECSIIGERIKVPNDAPEMFRPFAFTRCLSKCSFRITFNKLVSKPRDIPVNRKMEFE